MFACCSCPLKWRIERVTMNLQAAERRMAEQARRLLEEAGNDPVKRQEAIEQAKRLHAELNIPKDPSVWFDEKGKPIWPPKELYPDGALTEPVKRVLEPGVLLDRYGTPKGNFVAPKGTPYEMRSLPPGAKEKEYHVYEVFRPVETWKSVVAPWFGEVGLGTQTSLKRRLSSW